MSATTARPFYLFHKSFVDSANTGPEFRRPQDFLDEHDWFEYDGFLMTQLRPVVREHGIVGFERVGFVQTHSRDWMRLAAQLLDRGDDKTKRAIMDSMKGGLPADIERGCEIQFAVLRGKKEKPDS